MPKTAARPFPHAHREPLGLQRLYAEHGDYVRALVGRLLGPAGDPDDVTQEVFITAMRRLASEAVESPRAWLCQIAVKLAATARRKHRIRRAFGFLAPADEADWRTPETLAEARETIAAVAEALELMSEKRRTVFILFDIQGLSGQQVADALGCPLRTVHTRLFHARRDFVSLFHQVCARQAKARGPSDE